MGRYEFSLNANIKAKDGICPCYGCEGRNAGCHSKCEIFTIWNQKHLKNKKEMQKVKHTYYALYGVLRPKSTRVLSNPPDIALGDYSLTNVRGIYKGAGAKTGRKKVKEITKNAKKSATSKKKDDAAYLKAGTAVSILETKLISTGNLWARIPSGWLCVWEYEKDKLFIK